MLKRHRGEGHQYHRRGNGNLQVRVAPEYQHHVDHHVDTDAGDAGNRHRTQESDDKANPVVKALVVGCHAFVAADLVDATQV